SNASNDASLSDVTSDADGARADASGDAADPSRCTKDEECPSDGCLTGRCDKAQGTCAYDVCPSAACSARACNTTSRTCSDPTPSTFHTTAIKVATGAVGCAGIAARCIAASYPFLFVGTSNGVVAYSVADPTNASPKPIAVNGLPFLPSSIVGTGSRIYFVGA